MVVSCKIRKIKRREALRIIPPKITTINYFWMGGTSYTDVIICNIGLYVGRQNDVWKGGKREDLSLSPYF